MLSEILHTHILRILSKLYILYKTKYLQTTAIHEILRLKYNVHNDLTFKKYDYSIFLNRFYLHNIINITISYVLYDLNFKFRIEIFNLTEPVPLLCHLTDGEDYIILPTNSINGNKLSTWITCPNIKLDRATEYQITMVYSTDAIEATLRYIV